MRSRISLLVMPGLLALAACQKPPQDVAPAASLPLEAPAMPASSAASALPPVAASAVVAPAASAPASWVGRWLGPEGTYLDINGGPKTYRVTVRNLDGPRDFEATPVTGGGLTFIRDELTETVRPGNGTDTGMKWLADKRDCLIIKTGEGYCRG